MSNEQRPVVTAEQMRAFREAVNARERWWSFLRQGQSHFGALMAMNERNDEVMLAFGFERGGKIPDRLLDALDRRAGVT